MKRSLVTLIAVALLAGLAVAARAQTSYTVTPIAPRVNWASMFHYSVNPSGQVAGVFQESGRCQAFRWDPTGPNATTGTFTGLGYYGTYPNTAANGMNALGDVVGVAAPNGIGFTSALLWPHNGSVQDLGGGSVQEEAVAINRSGDIAISYYRHNARNNGTSVARVVRGKLKLFYLGADWPSDMNDAGQVLSWQGTLWTPTATGTTWTARNIGLSYTYDLNENGEAIGHASVTGSLGTCVHPFLYLPAAKYGLPGGTNDLWDRITSGLPAPSEGALWRVGHANGLNDNGVVIGDALSARPNGQGGWISTDYAIWLWDPVNGARSLSAIVAPTGWTLTQAYHKINNFGQIVATATDGTTEWCVLLTPVP